MSSSTATSFKEMYFSLSGRTNRDHFWFLNALPMAAMLTTLFMMGDDIATAESSVIGGLFWLLHLVVYLAVAWVCISVQVKRYHDKNSTGWWVFINIIPGLGAIWAMIESGMMAGDQTDNPYGPPPSSDRLQTAALGISVSAIAAALIYWIVQIGCSLEMLSLAYGWWE